MLCLAIILSGNLLVTAFVDFMRWRFPLGGPLMSILLAYNHESWSTLNRNLTGESTASHIKIVASVGIWPNTKCEWVNAMISAWRGFMANVHLTIHFNISFVYRCQRRVECRFEGNQKTCFHPSSNRIKTNHSENDWNCFTKRYHKNYIGCSLLTAWCKLSILF